MIKTHIRKHQIFSNEILLYFLKDYPQTRTRACISRIEWTEIKDDGSEPVAEPIRLMPEECQNLMDALWDVGCRPSEGSGSAGAMAAVQKHLEDMRTLVFKPTLKGDSK